jgi:hypothetical protein
MFASIFRDNLLAIAKAYAEANGVKLGSVSRKAYGNASFFHQLATGKHSISVKRAEEILNWFRKNWPEDTAWPPLRPIFMGRKDQK